jgi:hypothetical protein
MYVAFVTRFYNDVFVTLRPCTRKEYASSNSVISTVTKSGIDTSPALLSLISNGAEVRL